MRKAQPRDSLGGAVLSSNPQNLSLHHLSRVACPVLRQGIAKQHSNARSYIPIPLVQQDIGNSNSLVVLVKAVQLMPLGLLQALYLHSYPILYWHALGLIQLFPSIPKQRIINQRLPWVA